MEMPPASQLKVVVISIDGLRPEFYLNPKFKCPSLRDSMKRGSYSNRLRPVSPSITFPNHTTMVTGVRPSKHGIYANTKFTGNICDSEEWYFNASEIKVPTIWDVLNRIGKKTALIRWPVTINAKAEWIIPEVLNVENTETRSGWEPFVKYVDPKLLKLLKKMISIKIENREDHDVFVVKAVKLINETFHPDLVLCHLINLDHIQHNHSLRSKEVSKAVSTTDRMVSEIFRSFAPENTVFIILGDHGFAEIRKAIHVNTLLINNGWLEIKANRIQHWKALAKIEGGQATIYVKNPQMIEEITESLKIEEKGSFRIIGRQELDKLGALPDAACAIEPVEEHAAVCETNRQIVSELKKKHGQHGFLTSREDMLSGLIVCGPTIKCGPIVEEVSMLDIAPTLASIFGVRLESAEGKILKIQDNAETT